jgi:hypothetical protein
MCRRLKLRRFLNRDVKPERLELPDMPSNGALGVALVEIVGPELVIGAAIAHDVVRDFKDLMAHRDDGLLVAAMPFDAMVPRLKRRPVASGGRQAGLNQGAAQIPVALPRLRCAVCRHFRFARDTLRPRYTNVRQRETGTCRLPFQPRW